MFITAFVIANLVKPIPPPPPKYREVVTIHLETTELKTTENLPKPVEQPLEQQKELVVLQVVKTATDNLFEPGQCVWYIKNLRPEIPNSFGSAYQWLGNAAAQGWAIGSTPRIGAVGVRANHVVLIVSMTTDMVTTTEMNQHYIPFEITSRTLPWAYFTYIY